MFETIKNIFKSIHIFHDWEYEKPCKGYANYNNNLTGKQFQIETMVQIKRCRKCNKAEIISCS